MYATQFGLRAPAFLLNPDPNFYFGSRAHAEVLADLRYSVYRGEGFSALIGEAGVGKTVLVQTLLAELKPDKIVAAHLMILPAGDGELLRSILGAFGISSSPSKSRCLATLEAYLLTLVTRGQRALLVVDEAQNLSNEALEDLRMLSNLQLGNLGLIQIFLVGQPELARVINAAPHGHLRDRIVSTCHLRALEPAETRAYIEHRLRYAGWKGTPEFDLQAFETIHASTDGNPRRINLLCERLLLGASLNQLSTLNREQVEQVAIELQAELAPLPPAAAPTAEPAASAPALPAPGVIPEAPLLCVAGSVMDMLKARTINQQLKAIPEAPEMIIVSPLARAATQILDGQDLDLPSAYLEMHLAVLGADFVRNASEVLRRFEALLEVTRPRAVVIMGDTDALLACALVAHKRGLPVARLDAGLRAGTAADPQAMNAALLDRLADLTLAPHDPAGRQLAAEGLGGTAALGGSVLPDLAQHVERHQDRRAAVLRRCGATALEAERKRPYVIATIEVAQDDPWPADVADLLRAAHPLANVLWVSSPSSLAHMQASGFAAHIQREGIFLIGDANVLEQLALLRHALALVVDVQRHLADEAHGLGLPVVLFDAHGLVSRRPSLAFGASVVEDGDEFSRVLNQLPTAPHASAKPTLASAANRVASQLHAWLLPRTAPLPSP